MHCSSPDETALTMSAFTTQWANKFHLYFIPNLFCGKKDKTLYFRPTDEYEKHLTDEHSNCL